MDWTNLLDGFFKVSRSLLTPIIGIAVVYVAWQQHKTNRNKFRLDLYDRKLKVFEGLTTLLQHIDRQNTATGEQVQQYKIATLEAVFLFNEDIVNYLKEVKSKVHKLQFVNQKLDAKLPVEEQTKALSEQSDLLDWFNIQLTKSADKFREYMSFEEKARKAKLE